MHPMVNIIEQKATTEHFFSGLLCARVRPMNRLPPEFYFHFASSQRLPERFFCRLSAAAHATATAWLNSRH